MKISEIDRLRIENIGLKVRFLKQETDKLFAENDAIITKFCEENQLDPNKISIDVITGEVKLIEDKKEV